MGRGENRQQRRQSSTEFYSTKNWALRTQGSAAGATKRSDISVTTRQLSKTAKENHQMKAEASHHSRTLLHISVLFFLYLADETSKFAPR